MALPFALTDIGRGSPQAEGHSLDTSQMLNPLSQKVSSFMRAPWAEFPCGICNRTSQRFHRRPCASQKQVCSTLGHLPSLRPTPIMSLTGPAQDFSTATTHGTITDTQTADLMLRSRFEPAYELLHLSQP
jgi:hypothetical protein